MLALSQEENRNADFRNRNKSVGEQHIKLSCNPDGYKAKLMLETTQLESDIPRVPRVMRTKTARIRGGWYESSYKFELQGEHAATEQSLSIISNSTER